MDAVDYGKLTSMRSSLGMFRQCPRRIEGHLAVIAIVALLFLDFAPGFLSDSNDFLGIVMSPSL